MELVNGGPRVTLEAGDVLTMAGDILVLPTAAEGFLEGPWDEYLRELGVSQPDSAIRLGTVLVQSAPESANFRYLFFAASVRRGGSGASLKVVKALSQDIGRRAAEVSRAADVVSPLLGTGVGRLDPTKVLVAMKEGFAAEGPVEGRLQVIARKDDDWPTIKSFADRMARIWPMRSAK